MVRRITVCTLLAVGATTLAPAEIVSLAALSGGQTRYLELSNTVRSDDNMPEFLAVVAGIPVHYDQPDDQRADRPDANVYQRYLGLGFAHGMSAATGRSKPSSDECHGNGHEFPSNANGTAYSDCGDPSPSD